MKNLNHSKVFNYFLRLAMLIQYTTGTPSNQISTTAVAVQLDSQDELLNLNKRMSEVEAKNQRQENEIDLMKTLRVEDKEVINQLKTRIEQLEASANTDGKTENILSRQKRPFRLALANLNLGKANGFRDEEKTIGGIFYGPATNCDELMMLGYTLNGFYFVKGNNKAQQEIDCKQSIEIVYCEFHRPPYHEDTPKEVTENRLGFLDVKSSNSPSSGIYFYAQRGSSPTSKDGVIRFHKEHLNIGGGMNISTGVFTAPKSGIYHFSFSIGKEATKRLLDTFVIYLRVNKVRKGMGLISPGPIATAAIMQSTLKLKKGDRVDVWKPSTGALSECNNIGGNTDSEPCHHFTGWLLEEN